MNDILDLLTQARTRLEVTRRALRPLLDAGIDPNGELAPICAQFRRMESEVARIEDLVLEKVSQGVEAAVR